MKKIVIISILLFLVSSCQIDNIDNNKNFLNSLEYYQPVELNLDNFDKFIDISLDRKKVYSNPYFSERDLEWYQNTYSELEVRADSFTKYRNYETVVKIEKLCLTLSVDPLALSKIGTAKVSEIDGFRIINEEKIKRNENHYKIINLGTEVVIDVCQLEPNNYKRHSGFINKGVSQKIQISYADRVTSRGEISYDYDEYPNSFKVLKISGIATKMKNYSEIESDEPFYIFDQDKNDSSSGQRPPLEESLLARFGLNEGDKIVDISTADWISGRSYPYSVALSDSGRLFYWGYNINPFSSLKKAEKQPLVSNYKKPKEISSNFNIARSDKIMKFALGRDHYVVLTKLGKVFSWGDNKWGQIGDGTTINRKLPIEITDKFELLNSSKIIKIDTKGSNNVALSDNGDVFFWGYDGKNSPLNITTRFNLPNNEKIIDFELSSEHYVFLTSKGSVYSFGDPRFYKLGFTCSVSFCSAPQKIDHTLNLSENERATKIDVSNYTTGVLTNFGNLVMFGNNENIQIGHDKKKCDVSCKPEVVNSLIGLKTNEKIIDFHIDGYNSMIITHDRRVLIWGNNEYNQLSSVKIDAINSPVDFSDLHNSYVNSVHFGSNMFILYEDGKLFGWGLNDYSQIADISYEFINKPIDFQSLIIVG